ncbi:hypothetical protein Strvi_9361 (plasmid) [Streptomyces violaceusniger Tu 4113]|uniref:Uncharacterized protein n=1 Tax=Streptomyces violaceusniger (strain Tu 4113) TaxID=653045 RepID=G2PH50_STRV4|nr:hypothetical protein Strvi_9361 [Streptomyces violaceusniger Tu 4113]
MSHECKALLVNKVGSAWSPLGALESVLALDHQLIDHEAQTLNGTLEIFIREATGRLLSFESAPAPHADAPGVMALQSLRQHPHLRPLLTDRNVVVTSSNHR